jgi:hypothetical protein
LPSSAEQVGQDQIKDIIITLEPGCSHRYGSSSHVQQNGLLSHPQDLDAPLRLAAKRRINHYRQQYADNQNISFLPAIVSTSTHMHGEFLRLLSLQAHRETENKHTPRRTAMPLECHRNKTTRTSSVFAARPCIRV